MQILPVNLNMIILSKRHRQEKEDFGATRPATSEERETVVFVLDEKCFKSVGLYVFRG